MKKMLVLFAAVGLLSAPAFAANEKSSAKPAVKVVKVTPDKKVPQSGKPAPKVAAAKKADGYDLIQIGLWFNQPSETRYTDVFGVKVGAPICSGDARVAGIETAVICGATRRVDGLSACILWSDVKEMNGIQFSIANIAEMVCGFQLGIFNYAKDSSLQIGILNVNEKGFLPWFPVINFSVK
jgi:hypothetical protein